MSFSKLFLYFCLSFVGGVFFKSITEIPQLLMPAFLILGILLISVFWEDPSGKLSASNRKGKKLVVIGFCFLFLVFGTWRQQTAELKIMNNELRKYNDTKQEVTLKGTVSKEPDTRATNLKLTIKPRKIFSEDSEYEIRTEGNVLITTSRYPEYKYGDELKITGELETPPEFEDFNYKDYLAKEGIYSVIFYPAIELLPKKENKGLFSVIYGGILEFKNKLRKSIYQNLSPPQSSILGAMILGDKRRMSENLKEKLSIVGLRHITAISGMHIMILSGVLMFLGISLGLWRGQAFYFALILLALFIVMVGMPSSAIRAGIMGGIFLLGQKLGRLSFSFRAIVFAATIMLIINPLLLSLDVGFQLSFLAVAGIIYLMPSFQNWLKFLPNPDIFPLRSLLSMTLAAQIFTLPILIYNFGYMSFLAPITNVLIVPLLPYIMVLGFIFGLAGMICHYLGWLFSLPAWFLLSYVIKIVDWFSQVPFATLTLEISWVWLIFSYLILGFITWRLNEKQKLKFLNY